jgi:hypothetical protein
MFRLWATLKEANAVPDEEYLTSGSRIADRKKH